MGPITLFDKSFLQSLSLDESVWFDHFFLTNVCPLFYGETLADLDKSVREGRTPEQEVGVIADKFPEMHGMPCGHHRNQCIGELLGQPVPMTGQIPLAGGRRVESEGGRAAVFEPSPEADAFARWQRREFLEIEHQHARIWRREVAAFDVAKASAAVKSLGVDLEKCKDLVEAKALATYVFSGRKKPFELFNLALIFLGVPERLRPQMLKRWIRSGKPQLVKFAPYSAHVLEVEMFFQIALATKLISSERASNRLDIAYLFYLPFCMMFVSTDHLHRNCAPLFLRPDQEFVWGPDLKTNLGQINEHYLQLPESVKEAGVYSFTDAPPRIGNQVVHNLWARLLPKWREGDEIISAEAGPPPPGLAEIMRMAQAPEILTGNTDLASGELDQVLIKRRVKRRKGSWYQVPKALNTRNNPH